MQPASSCSKGCVGCVASVRGDWCGLSGSELERLDADRHTRIVEAGALLVNQDDPCLGLCCVKVGFLAVRSSTPDGGQHLLDIVGPGELLGVELVAEPDSRYPYRVEAMTPAHVCFLSRETVHGTRSPELLGAMLRTLGRRSARAARTGLTLRIGDARSRLIELVLRWADRYGMVQHDASVILPIPIRQQDLASLIGVTPETMSRLLARMATEGTLQTSRRGLRIPVLAKLQTDRAA